MKKIRVLIVDDSALMRKKIREMLESDKDIEVVAAARDGEDCILKARDLKPDVITLDINMPKMDGLTALAILIEEDICPVIMLSSLTQEGAATTFEALELGAFDFVPKPGGTVSLNIELTQQELISKVYAAAGVDRKKLTRRINRVGSVRSERPELVKPTIFKRTERVNGEPPKSAEVRKSAPGSFKAVCIGISTGGPKTIFDVLPLVKKDINAAIFMVQHMPPGFTESFAKRLNDNCEIEVKEAEAGDIIRPGVCYLGKGGYHMSLYKKHSGEITMRLTTKPQHSFMPSADVSMESILEAFGGNKTMGILMTGMGDDGADSMVKIRKAGGFTVAESEETCVVFGMPKEAINRDGADLVLPSYKIAAEINTRISRGW